MRWFTSASGRLSILAMFSRGSSAFDCNNFRSSSIKTSHEVARNLTGADAVRRGVFLKVTKPYEVLLDLAFTSPPKRLVKSSRRWSHAFMRFSHAMSRKRMLLGVCLSVVAAIGLAVMLFRARYSRTVTLRDLTNGETQTVSVAFNPHHMDWKVSGDVEGSGFVVLSYVYSNRVSGKFSVGGGGDYY